MDGMGRYWCEDSHSVRNQKEANMYNNGAAKGQARPKKSKITSRHSEPPGH
jgi:hypothetical protein